MKEEIKQLKLTPFSVSAPCNEQKAPNAGGMCSSIEHHLCSGWPVAKTKERDRI